MADGMKGQFPPTGAALYGILARVIYALRKLIAFVFLGGMFWFIYQDLGNLDQPWFLHALALITLAFAFFWLLVPVVVVRSRIRRRIAQNNARYVKWRAEGGVAKLRPRSVRNVRLMAVEPDEQAFFHEKGTLYAASDTLLGRATERPRGRPSEVAFPGMRREFHVYQRTHCYMTSCRIVFQGKDLDASVLFRELKGFSVSPGGIVFEVMDSTLLFTFQNPLVAAAILRCAKEGQPSPGSRREERPL